VHEGFANYRLDLVSQALHEFTWHELCDWYLEMVKPRLYEDDKREVSGVLLGAGWLGSDVVAGLALARAGLPVEIIAEYETWRRIRDSEGTEGWVLHSLLSGRRTALVMPWAKKPEPPIKLLDRAEDGGGVVVAG
jgi:hypothetical protein